MPDLPGASLSKNSEQNPGDFCVQIQIARGAKWIGGDRGVVWFEHDSMHFVGDACDFVLNRTSILKFGSDCALLASDGLFPTRIKFLILSTSPLAQEEFADQLIQIHDHSRPMQSTTKLPPDEPYPSARHLSRN